MFDALNRVLCTTDQLGDTVIHNHEAAGRLLAGNYRTRVNSPSGPISDSDSFTCNSNSLMLIYPDGSEVNRGYTARGQLYTLALGSTPIDTRSYDNGGRLTGSVFNNGVSESRSYSTDSLVTAINFTGAAIGNLAYAWDANHNKTSETISGIMSGYGFTAAYDADDRLIGWQRTGTPLNQSWNLSPVGNWNSVTQNASTQVRTHSAANEILTAASQSVQHDAKGNATLLPLSLRPAGGTPLPLKWDFSNRLQAADSDNSGTDDVFYLWDALGRRVGRTSGGSTTIYFHNGQQTLADYTAGATANSPTHRYIWGEYIDELVLRTSSGGNHYFHRNQQYSLIAATTSTGAIAERYAYTAYGQLTITNAASTIQPSSPSNNRYTYTGREWDDKLKLYHYRARMYSPLAGRFVTRDPIGYEGSEWSLYEYVSGRPQANLDPFGLTEFHDSFGRWCCGGEDHDIQIGVRAPCRPVHEQIADNLRNGLPPMKGVVTGHAWIQGSNRHTRVWFNIGVNLAGPNPLNGPIAFVPEGPNVAAFGFTHRVRFKACPESFNDVFESIRQSVASVASGGEDAPRYCAIDLLPGGQRQLRHMGKRFDQFCWREPGCRANH